MGERERGREGERERVREGGRETGREGGRGGRRESEGGWEGWRERQTDTQTMILTPIANPTYITVYN